MRRSMLSLSASHGRAAREPQLLASYDPVLMWVTLLLLTLGVVMVYSASIATAEASRFSGYRSTYFLARHGLFVAIGISMAAVTVQIPVRVWQKLAPWLFVMGVVLLVLVLIPGIGKDVN